MNKKQVIDAMSKWLPKLSDEERQLLESLPGEFQLEVPYQVQEKMHWSGAAVVQMLRQFHEGISVPQDLIAHEAGWQDWRRFNHETFKEDLARYMAKRNYVPGMYYPGRYVLPKHKTGVNGADFIAQNYEVVNEIGFAYFKALLVATDSPVYVRLHFHTGEYPMPEEMATVLDTCGHAVLITGFNEKGFIVHDPWNRDAWGGTTGGANVLLPYQVIILSPSVNCCLGYVGWFTRLKAWFDYPRSAIHQERKIELVVNVELPGVRGVLSDIYPVNDLQAQLIVGGDLRLQGPSLSAFGSKNLAYGSTSQAKFSVMTGGTGSHPVEALVQATVTIPAFAWEKIVREERVTVSALAQRRLDVKDKEWIDQYGRE